MCIQAIKSVGVKEYASELWTSIKEIDGGKDPVERQRAALR
ncbi:MAG: hypothetical protein ACLSHG_06855 [Oscillospiraceae bacterium]